MRTRGGQAVCVSVLLVSAALCGGLSLAQGRPDGDTRSRMQSIAAALAELLPRSVDEARLSDPGEREAVLAWLSILESASSDLAEHAAPGDVGFAVLGRSLADDLSDARSRFEHGKPRQTSFLLHRVTRTCVGCHSRLPDEQARPLTQALLARVNDEALDRSGRARLALATRQFEQALTHFEASFADPSVSPAKADVRGDLVDYLTTCLRVRSDVARPLQTLDRLAERRDVPAYLRTNLNSWRAALRELAAEQPSQPGLAHARSLVETARRARDFPADRNGLVHDIAATGELYRLIEAGQLKGLALADASYLLGVTSAGIRSGLGPQEADAFLELAIRTAPDSHVARKALRLLEERLVFAWSGSGGTDLPEDLGGRLDELRGLIADSQKANPALEAGRRSYMAHCANCHGNDGRGGGPMQPLLTVRPANLTRLSRRNGGTFPSARVQVIVDGRADVRGHGALEMPIWGLSLSDRGRGGQDAEVSQQIAELAAWLETIQESERKQR